MPRHHRIYISQGRDRGKMIKVGHQPGPEHLTARARPPRGRPAELLQTSTDRKTSLVILTEVWPKYHRAFLTLWGNLSPAQRGSPDHSGAPP
jgi:hypothetical protein